MLFTNRSKTRKHGILLESPVDGDERCSKCGGACCSSFPCVDLSWIEYETLKTLGATRLQFSLFGNPKLIIENGCEFLTHGRCSIYEHRPDICRRFYCKDD